MNKKLIHISAIIMCVLCIAVSFAWMIDITSPSGHFPTFRFDNTIYIASNNIDVQLEIENEDGVYENIQTNAPELYSVNNVGPGHYTKYRMTITNRTDVEVNLSVILSEFTTSTEEFYKNTYVGVFSSQGFFSPYNPPENKEVNIYEALRNNTVTFIDYFRIPNVKDVPVVVRFYVRIDHEAGNELMNQSLTIGKINFLTV